MKRYLWNPWKTADRQPDRTAILDSGERWTFRQLIDDVECLRRGISDIALPDGSVIGTDLPVGPDFFALALAALRDGYGLFPIAREWGQNWRNDFLARAGAKLDIRASSPEGPSANCVSVAAVRAAGRERPGQSMPQLDRGARGGYMVYTTSGTTGMPKVVTRSRPWYPYSGVAVTPAYGAGPDHGPHIMANPTYHLGTVGLALYALQAGSAVIVQRQWSPGGFRELVDMNNADSAFMAPIQMADLVRDGVAPRHAMAVLFNGGAATARGLKDEAIHLLGPIIHEFYGTSQGIISEVSAAEWLKRKGTVGRPIPGVRVSVRAGEAECGAAETGHIHVHYRAIDLGESPRSYTDTGDLGYRDDEGYLFVVGRAPENGSDQTAALEHLIRLLPDVIDVAAIPQGSGAVTCFVEHNREDGDQLGLEIESIVSHLRIRRPAIAAGPAGKFPRTPSGKLWRARLADLSISGEQDS